MPRPDPLVNKYIFTKAKKRLAFRRAPVLRSRLEPFHLQNSLDPILFRGEGSRAALVRAEPRDPQVAILCQLDCGVQQRPFSLDIFTVRSDGVKAANRMLRLIHRANVELATDVLEQVFDCHNFSG